MSGPGARNYDVAIIGSGAGGGTVAAALGPAASAGKGVLVLERGPRYRPEDFTGREIEMATALYAEGGGHLNVEGTMTLAYARAYGGSTVVYTGTSLLPPPRIIDAWRVPGLTSEDLTARAARYAEANHVHLLPEDELNDNNRLFRDGCRKLGLDVRPFPVNVKGCRGSSLCNLGCPNGAKQGTHQVQLPAAESQGVTVVTRAEVLRLGQGEVEIVVHPRPPGGKGSQPEWPPGPYTVRADRIVLAGGVLGTVPLLCRSGLGPRLPRLGQGFTCHPALILAARHDRPITNDVGHPKSFYLDRAQEEGFLLETCMYFPFVAAKNLAGHGAAHADFLRAFPHLQMILVLACDKVHPANRVGVDARGAAVVRYRYTPLVRRSFAAAARTAARIFFAAGARAVHTPLSNPAQIDERELDRLDERIHERNFLEGHCPVSAAHLMGGCAMGRGARDSVCDASGRVHGLPRLYVADASLFPDSVEINPYLTIMALADRVAEGLREELGV